MRRPLIGVTTSEVRLHTSVAHTKYGDPPQREMALGLPYMQAIERAGGLPVVLPPLELSLVVPLLDNLDGLMLSGGPDLDPDGYAASDRHPQLGPTEPALDSFELEIARAADRRGLPVLGICRGAQAMNVARGGTLHQHLPDVTDGTVEHRQELPGRNVTHTVRVAPGSLLDEITGGGPELAVNSFHHQAVDRLGDALVAVAWAPDGVVEAIEDRGSETLWLGVQWHAETLLDRAPHLALFAHLVEVAAVARDGGQAARAA